MKISPLIFKEEFCRNETAPPILSSALRRFFSRAFIFALALTFVAAPAWAQLRVVSVTPRADDLHAPTNAAVRVTFDQALNENTLSSRPLRVWGSFRGEYQGSLNYDSSTSKLSLAPFQSFIESEEITVVLKNSVRSLAGAELAQPLVWRFTIANPFGTANFTPVVIDLNSNNSQEPTQIIPADFDNDSFIDLAVVHRGSNQITVLRNTFRATSGAVLATISTTLATQATPVSAVAADFNSDGRMDLAVANFNSNTVQLFTGDGALGFSTPRAFDTGEHPSDLIAHDFDGDGDLDLAVAMSGIDQLAILRNDSLGFFVEAQRLQVGASPNKLTAWDFDGDSDLDLVVANSGNRTLSIFRNDASGVFAPAGTITLALTPVDLKTGDIAGRGANLVGDGRRELVVLGSDLPFLGKISESNAAGTSQVSVISWNAGTNTFNTTQSLTLDGRGQSFVLCDVDSIDAVTPNSPFQPDRDLDIFMTRFWDDRLSWLRNSDNALLNPLSLGDVDSVRSAKAIAYFDVDRDGDNDLAISNYLDNQLVIYRNGGQRITPCGLVDSLGNDVATINFGEVAVGSTGLRGFFLPNDTSLDFLFSTTLSDSIHFRILPASGSLPAGENVPVRIEFAPTDTVSYSAVLLIRLNDHLNANETCAIILQGRGVQPAIFLPNDSLDFGCTPPGATAIRELVIENHGNFALDILSGATSTSQFVPLVNMAGLRIPPRTAIRVAIAFRPDRLGDFVDSLQIRSTDPANPLVIVQLRGCGSNSGPVITSADTLRATEDIEATYIAAADDPDGGSPTFRFLNLPHWLSASNDTVRGTPREGDRDSSFTVIASDGFFNDTLRVIVIVTPVNDAPVFDSLGVLTVFEEELLTFTLVARDPEDSTFTLTAQNLPNGASFVDRGEGRGDFSWRPPLGSAGQYSVTFIAQEQVANAGLTSIVIVPITVLKRLPDLFVQALTRNQPVIKRNQRIAVTAVFGDSLAPVTQAFTAGLFLNNTLVADTTINEFARDGSFSLTREVVFDQTGRQVLEARIDIGNQIPELNEANNILRLEVQVEAGELAVAPNPFTPNADGYNDEVIFDLRDFEGQELELKIFGLRGELLRTFNATRAVEFRWNGKSENGEPQYPGPYLYLLTDRGKKIASGYIVLAR